MGDLRRMGIVVLSEEYLLELLQFSGGRILAMQFAPDTREVEILMEHEEMPELAPGMQACRHDVSYVETTAEVAPGIFTKTVTREHLR